MTEKKGNRGNAEKVELAKTNSETVEDWNIWLKKRKYQGHKRAKRGRDETAEKGQDRKTDKKRELKNDTIK